MTVATLDLATWTDGQLDSQQSLQRLADAVAALWSAGTGLALQPAAVALDDTHARVVLAEPSSSGAREEPPEALLSRLAGVPVTLSASWRHQPTTCWVARLPGCAPATAGSRVGLSLSCRWHQPKATGWGQLLVDGCAPPRRALLGRLRRQAGDR